MNTFWTKIAIVFKDPVLKRRILFTIGALVVFRLLATIPVPGIDVSTLDKLINSSQFFGMLDLFSGGGISRLSIVMLGVGPYITASIIMQLLTMMIPSLKNMLHEEGEAGRQKLSQYSRVMSVPLALIQSVGFLILLENQAVIPHLAPFVLLVNVLVVTGGSVLLMWIGEIIGEFGIGNGVSLIIFAGIIARLPGVAGQFAASFDVANIPLYLVGLAVAIVVIGAVVYITEAERSVPVTYAKQVRGTKVYGGASSYLPLRLNQAGVIPIIFALSILLFPQIISNLLSHWTAHPTIAAWATSFTVLFNNHWVYGIAYFILVVLFTYFYTAV